MREIERVKRKKNRKKRGKARINEMIYRAWCVGGATAVEQGPPSEPEDYLAALRLGLQKRAATNVEAVDLAAHSRSESNRFTGSGDVTSSDLLWPVILVRLTLNPQIVIVW